MRIRKGLKGDKTAAQSIEGIERNLPDKVALSGNFRIFAGYV